MKKISMLFGSVLLIAVLTGCATLGNQTQEPLLIESSDAAYLEEFFGVSLQEESIDSATFISALADVVGQDVATADGLMIFKALVDATDLSELAETYSEEKAAVRLETAGLKDVTPAMATYVACALDAHLVTPTMVRNFVKSGTFTHAEATGILMNIAQANGMARKYLGKISDPDILQRISNEFASYTLYSDGNLDEIGALAVQQRASTGYNLKIESENAQFLSSRTLQYGHSDEVHLKQLVVLLNSEGIDAKIQIEPKVSIYEYLLDWGPVPEPSPFYMVLEFSDNFYLAYAVEYDAKFEFEHTEDLLQFDSIINTYAKKNDANQAEDSTEKLISGAWWQPLYSATFNPDPEAYIEIVDCVLVEGGYSIHPFSLIESKENLITTLESLSGLPVDERPIFVNHAFHRYLTGEDYQ